MPADGRSCSTASAGSRRSLVALLAEIGRTLDPAASDRCCTDADRDRRASGLIGAVTFWGSLVAFGKLQGIVKGNAVLFAGADTCSTRCSALGTLTLVVRRMVMRTRQMRPWHTTGLWWNLAASSVSCSSSRSVAPTCRS